VFRIVYDNENRIRKDIARISVKHTAIIKKAIEERLVKDPMAATKPLKGTKHGLRRLRVGDYRVVFHIDHKKELVIISTIRHRKDVYD
jgi:mRNA interferase RelE/StbE